MTSEWVCFVFFGVVVCLAGVVVLEPALELAGECVGGEAT